MAQLAAGDRAPSFALADDAGGTVTSEGLRGKPYILYFYPKDDTPGCTTEACQFNENLSAFERAGLPVIGVSRDDPASHRRFREKYALRFPLLSDPEARTHRAYGAWGARPGRGEGVIRSTFFIDADGRVRKAWYAVRPDGHAHEVLAELARQSGPA